MTDMGSNAEKPVDEWVTGDEPMTGPQRSYLETLAREAGQDVPDSLSKAEASVMIERLQKTTGRGDPAPSESDSGELPLAATDSRPGTPSRTQNNGGSDEWIEQTMGEGDIANGEGDPDAGSPPAESPRS